MKKIITIALLGIVLVPSMKAQKTLPGTTGRNNTTFPIPQFVDEVKKVGSELVIPYKRYKMSNGLTILIHEDHSDPIVYVDVTYHVGSAREQQGRSGFAHFFEHMMFQGSKNVADEQHFKVITEAGGTLNGTTNTDRTNYFEVVPSNQLEKMLWLESDRMGFLLDSVTQRKFEVQRATVKNERGQRYDNAPYGVVMEKIGEALFPKGHPYSWSTIGYLVDLDRVDVNDLKRFYMRWYGPNNAVLTVAGDVDVNQVLLLAQKYFGSIPVGKDVKPQKVEPFKLTESRYVSYEDNVRFPQISIAYPSIKTNTKDNAALEVLANILSGSQGSPLYKGFIETKKAVSAFCFQYARELDGQFQFNIRANAGTKLAEIETEFNKILLDWETKGGAKDDDLAKFKASYKTSLINGLSTVQGKGATLAANFTFTGDANYLKKQVALYNSLTKADVMRVYNQYIKGKTAVFLSCVPKGKSELIAKADNWKMYERTIETESDEYKNLSYNEPKDDFDRSKMPLSTVAKPVPVPNFYKTLIAARIPAIGVEDKEIPTVNINISFKAGHRFEPKEKSGISKLLAAMLGQSTIKTKADEIENKLDRLGSSVSVNAGDEDMSVTIQSTKQNLLATLKIVEESMFECKYDPEEFEIEKKGILDNITQGLTNAGVMADNAFRKVMYGNDHIMAIPSIGTPETIKSLTIDDVKNYYANKILINNASIAISGDIKQAEIEKALSFLNKLKSGTIQELAEPALPVHEKTRLYLIDKKNAAQSEIRFGYLALPYDATGEFYKANVMNYSFAGAFNSRINVLLREAKGWTYGTRGGFSGSKFAGPYAISGGFKANTTDSTCFELINELNKIATGSFTDEEISFTKNAMMQSDALKYESPMQKLGFIKRVLDYNLPKDYVAQQAAILNSITKDELNALAKKYLQLGKMNIIVVGDKASNLDKLKKLGFEIIELDPTNNQMIQKF
ncbi:MAG: M16 family metallopeptidase [Bacteroidota bacterium]